MKKKVWIIGGGASGMMAAITAAKEGMDVTIAEHMDRVGKKILSTGNGRCNLTNLHQDASCYRSSQPDFPGRVLKQFSVNDPHLLFHSFSSSPAFFVLHCIDFALAMQVYFFVTIH